MKSNLEEVKKMSIAQKKKPNSLSIRIIFIHLRAEFAHKCIVNEVLYLEPSSLSISFSIFFPFCFQISLLFFLPHIFRLSVSLSFLDPHHIMQSLLLIEVTTYPRKIGQVSLNIRFVEKSGFEFCFFSLVF